MLLVDDRQGSAELAPLLARLGLPVEVCRLPFGDVAFAGRGIQGAPIDIGIELKTLGDLASSLRTDRLAGYQLPGLLSTYDHVWLIVEGVYGCDKQGQVTTTGHRGRATTLHGKMALAELEGRLLSLEVQAGVHVKQTFARWHTVKVVERLYRYWTDRNADEHRSHVAIHQLATIRPVSKFRQTVAQFPHIGLKTSRQVEQHFNGSLQRAVNAGVKEWAAIPTSEGGKRIGSKIAEAIVRFLQGDSYER